MPPAELATPYLAEAMVAFTGVVVLFYGWRGLHKVPLLPRLALGLAFPAVVVPACAALVLALGHANGLDGALAWRSGRMTAAVKPSALPAQTRAVPAGVPSPPAALPPASTPAPAVSAAPAGREPASGPAPEQQPPPPVPASQPLPQLPPAHVALAPVPVPPSAAVPIPPSAPVAGPLRAPTPAPAADENGRFLLYATSRAAEGAGKAVRFGFERSDQATLGRVRVAPARSTPAAGEGPGVEEAQALSTVDMAAAAAAILAGARRFKGHALVLVHGYNTDHEAALARGAALASAMDFDGVVGVFSWPSIGKLPSYSYDRESALGSGPQLRAMLEVLRDGGARQISIVAEGLGALTALQGLQHLNGSVPLGHIVLAAPDLAPAELAELVAAVRGAVKGVTLYAASGERSLAVSRRYHGGAARVGDVTEVGPRVGEGVETIDVGVTGPADSILRFAPDAGISVAGDIATLLRTGEPANLRLPSLQRVQTGRGGEYWRHPLSH